MLFVQVQYPNPASVAFLILLHVRCISNAILLCSPSLSLSFPLSLCSGLLFALRKLKRNYYNLYYLQLSCPSELAQLPRPYPPTLVACGAMQKFCQPLAKKSLELLRLVHPAPPPAPPSESCSWLMLFVLLSWQPDQKCRNVCRLRAEMLKFIPIK